MQALQYTGVENEIHFTLHCAALWMPLIDHMNTLSPSFEDLGMEDHIRCVMMEANQSRKIAKYLYRMYMKKLSLLSL